MSIVGIELEYIPTFHILPHAYISLGKSIWLSFSWLNFQLTIKHISCDYKACKWLLCQEEMIGISFEDDFIERFKKAMEE